MKNTIGCLSNIRICIVISYDDILRRLVVAGVHYYIFPDCRVWYPVHTHGEKKKSPKRPSRRAVISVRSYTGIDRYGRMFACLFFILYFLPFPSDRADCGIHFGRRICVCTPRVGETSIKRTIHMAASTDISTDKRWRYDIGFESCPVGRRDTIRLRRRGREKAGKKVIAVDGVRKKSKQSVYIYSVIHFI